MNVKRVNADGHANHYQCGTVNNAFLLKHLISRLKNEKAGIKKTFRDVIITERPSS
jgi:acid stress-induced BolA-like protein IbaG/YrbA